MKPVSFWDERYSGPGFVFGTEPNDHLRAMVPALSAGNCLCLGEGEGRNACFLASLGHQVSALDQSETGLAKAARLAASRGLQLETRACDLTQEDLGLECWDGIVSIFLHLHQAERKLLHERVVRALRPGGWYLLEAYTPAQIGRKTGGPQDPAHLMTLPSLALELQGLELLKAVELERPVIEGHGHTGLAAVVQLFARKPL